MGRKKTQMKIGCPIYIHVLNYSARYFLENSNLSLQNEPNQTINCFLHDAKKSSKIFSLMGEPRLEF